MDVKTLLENGDQIFLPNLSIDLVIIGYKESELKCLLLQLGDKWALPGGYIKREESVDEALIRVLKDRTSLANPHFKFLSVFGKQDRRFDQEFKGYFEKHGFPWQADYFINNRFVTLAYYSLVDIDKLHPKAQAFSDAVAWHSFDALPPLWLDHREILEKAREKLKSDITQENVTFNLLPEAFTMPELHRLHQNILDEKIDRSRFQKKMLASDKFIRLPQLQTDAPGRKPYLYKIKASNK